MWAGSLSHCGLSGLGAVEDWATHQLGHALSAVFGYTHGETLTAVWGAWARYVLPPEGSARFAQYARNVWGMEDASHSCREVCDEGIRRTEAFFAEMGLPISLGELCGGTLPEERLQELTDACTYHGLRGIGAYRKLDGGDIYQIYTAANH